MPVAAILREATSAALGQRIASAATVAVIAALCCVVLLTTGRTVGAANSVLTAIDTTGTRSIVVRAGASSGLDTSVLARLAHVDAIEWAGAFGPASDVVNAAFAGGARVPLRSFHPGVWGPPPTDPPTRPASSATAAATVASAAQNTPPGPASSATAVVASAAQNTPPRGTVDAAGARALGLADGVGTVQSVGDPGSSAPSPPGGGTLTDVTRTADPALFLRFLEPTVLVPDSADGAPITPPTATTRASPASPTTANSARAPGAVTAAAPPPAPVAVLVVLARTPAQVAALAAVVSSVLDVRDTSTVTVTTSEQLAALRDVVQRQLGGFGQSLVATVFAATTLVVGSMLYALVMLRRRDFGRRRALGATRALVVELLLVQVALLAGVGSLLGSGAASVALVVLGDPLPTPQFFVALAVLATLSGVVSAVVPAVVASRRDPLRELRVP